MGGVSAVGRNLEKGDCVVILHGALDSARSFKRMETFFNDKGYAATAISYPYRSTTIEEIADQYIGPLIEAACSDPRKPVHFVAHSMGGLVIRKFLADYNVENLGRVVMLGTPNDGSPIAEALKNWKPYQWLYGTESGSQLGTDSLFIEDLPPADFDLGVIAGTRHTPLATIFFGRDPNDGKVGVRSAMVDGMQDFLIMRVGHVGMKSDRNVFEQALYFLLHGEFER